MMMSSEGGRTPGVSVQLPILPRQMVLEAAWLLPRYHDVYVTRVLVIQMLTCSRHLTKCLLWRC
jgi:hypothetical protein